MKKELIKKHLLVLLAGFLHSLKYALAYALLAAVVALFISLRFESGYLAVGQFIAALLLIALSALVFYSCGRDMTGGKFSK